MLLEQELLKKQIKEHKELKFYPVINDEATAIPSFPLK